MKGYISYSRGAPPISFPKMEIKYVKCIMSDFQYDMYLKILRKEEKTNNTKIKKSIEMAELPNDFYIGTRMASNIVFPNKKKNEYGYESLTDNKIKNK